MNTLEATVQITVAWVQGGVKPTPEEVAKAFSTIYAAVRTSMADTRGVLGSAHVPS